MKAVIFDMDGVLIDSETLARRAYTQACAEFGFEFTESLMEKLKGRSVADNQQTLSEHFGQSFPAEQVKIRRQELGRKIIEKEGLRAIPGAAQLLCFLHDAAVPLAVATTTRSSVAKENLARLGLLQHISFLIGGEQVQQRKPAPEIYLRAAAGLGVRPQECLVLEDSVAGIEAACSAGTMPVFFSQVQESRRRFKERGICCISSLSEAFRVFRQHLHDVNFEAPAQNNTQCLAG